jgi:hypothetical protein
VCRSKLWYALVDFYSRLVPVIVFLVAPAVIATADVISVTFSYGPIPFIDPYLIFVLWYGIKPYRFKEEKHFRERGFESVNIEFQTSKIIFVILVSVFVISTFVISTVVANAFPEVVGLLLFAIIGAGFRILTHVMHKEFRYYLAKGYCITATKKEDEFEKANYLSAVLDSYNKYLRRRTQIEIKDIKRIYATFLAAEIKEKNQIIKSVCESLEGDRLGLARYLSNVYKVPETEFFVGESDIQKMKPVGTFLAAAIPIIVSIIVLVR